MAISCIETDVSVLLLLLLCLPLCCQQMDPANYREALREAAADEAEGERRLARQSGTDKMMMPVERLASPVVERCFNKPESLHTCQSPADAIHCALRGVLVLSLLLLLAPPLLPPHSRC